MIIPIKESGELYETATYGKTLQLGYLPAAESLMKKLEQNPTPIAPAPVQSTPTTK